MSRRRARTREQILGAAEAAFGTAGYRGVRMEELAEAADVSVGSIYGHFGNKDGVYLALVERALEQFAGYLDRAFDPSYSPLEQAMAAGEVYLRFHLEHPGSFRFLAFDGVETRMPEVDGRLRGRVGERLEEILGSFQLRIQEAIDAGQADAGYDAKLVARFLWGAWNGVVSFGLRTDRMSLSDDEIAACLRMGRRLVNEGLTAPGHRDAEGHSLGRLLDGAR
jgi:AcrR family transcriptional regulator